MSLDIRDNPGRKRFEIELDGHVAYTQYRLAPGVITFIHTLVPPELGGRGVGTALAKGVLAEARARGLKVIARCPFVAAYIRKHPGEYDDLLAEPVAPA